MLPRNTITVLSVSCVAAFVAYVALVLATIFFASWETELSAKARAAESRIATLETEYYDTIAHLSVVDLSGRGLMNPTRVEYVAAGGAPAVTRADR